MKTFLKGVDRWFGLLLTLAALCLIQVLRQYNYVPAPSVIVIPVVVIATLKHGLPKGLLACFMAWIYALYFFSEPGTLFKYSDDAIRRIVLLAFATPITVSIISYYAKKAGRTSKAEKTSRDLKSINRELAASEELLQMFIRSTPAAVAMFDKEMRYLRTSQGWEASFGRKANELQGRSHYEIYPNLPSAWKEAHRRTLKGERLFHVEDWVELEGGEKCFRWESIPWRDAQNQIGGIILFTEDITTQKNLERKQRLSNERIERQRVALLKLASRKTVIDENLDESLEVITQTVSEALGLQRVSVWLLDEQNQSLDCRCLYLRDSNSFSKGESIRVEEYPTYFRAVEEERAIVASRAEDHPALVELDSFLKAKKISSMIDAPIRLGGRTVGVVCHEHTGEPREWRSDEESFAGSVADFVALVFEQVFRRETEKALRKSEERYRDLLQERLRASDERYRALVDAAPVGILIMDSLGKITFLNETLEKYLKIPREQLLGKDFRTEGWRLRHSDGSPMQEGEAPHAKVLLNKKPVFGEELLVESGDGTMITFSVNCSPIFNAEGSISEVVTTAMDISTKSQHEAALLASETRFRQFAENIREVFWMTDPEKNQMLYVSPAYEEVWGRSRESLYQRPMSFLEAIVKEDRDRVVGALSLQAKGKYDMEYRVQRPDGSIRWIRDRAFPVKDSQGKTYRVAGIAEDISDQKRALVQIEESNRFMDSVIENLPVMLFIKDAKTLEFVRFNRTAERLLGISRKEMLGKSDYDFFPKDEADFFNTKDREVLREGRLVDIPEEPIQTANGVRVLHTLKIPITDFEGNPKYLLGISEDITERKEAEKNQKLLANITALSVDAISTGDCDGKVTFWNKAAERIFGFKAEEVLGRHVKDFFVPPEEQDEVDKILEQSPTHPKSIFRKKTERLHKDGRRIPVMITGFPLFDERGNYDGRAGILQDLTEIEDMQQRLLHKSRMAAIGEMAAGIAHEIRNPLFGISTVAQILAKENQDHPELSQLTESMIGEIERLKKLLESLLLYARPKKVERTKISAHAFLRSLIAVYETNSIEKGLQIETSLDPAFDEEFISLDPDQIRQIFLNLYLNAIEASSYGGKIKISSSFIKDDTWKITFHNEGEVIPEENLKRIFEPFFSSKKTGHGLGLAVTQKLIAEHGGEIRCESTRLSGTTFSVYLPKTQRDKALEERSQRTSNAPAPSSIT